MKFYALSTKKPCKHCGKFHGYITYKHRIVIGNEDSKHFMEQFATKHQGSKVVKVDMPFLIKKRIPLVDIIIVMQQPVPQGSSDGSGG